MADNSGPTAHGEPEQEPTGEFARGDDAAAQLQRNPIKFFHFLVLDFLPGLVLHYIRMEARTLRENNQFNKFNEYDDFLRDYVTALTQRGDRHGRYRDLTAAHFDNFVEFLGRPGIVLQWHGYSDEANLVNGDRFSPMAKVYARGDENETDIGEEAESMREYFQTFHASARVLVDAWRQGDPLPEQEGGGEMGMHGIDSFEVDETQDLPQLARAVGETLRPPPTDNLNVLNMRDGQFPIENQQDSDSTVSSAATSLS